MKHLPVALLFASAVLFAGCTLEDLEGLDKVGTPIVFTANTSYSNGIPTRTVYSGKDENNNTVVSTSQWERIDWVTGDLISIYCAGETAWKNLFRNATGHVADYRITSHSETADDWRESRATLANAGTNGLTWEEKAHVFFALYPSPSTSGVDGSKVSVDGNRFRGIIPASQTKSLKAGSTTFYLPDMNYAYMWAASESAAGQDVSLDFKPLMTAFEFTVDSAGEDELQVYSFSMTSSQDLYGEFAADVSGDLSGFTLSSVSNGGKTVSVDFGGTSAPTVIHKGNPITFTVFTLPRSVPDLTIAFETDKGTKTLELKQNDAWVEFPGCKKIRITGLGIPSDMSWEYHLTDLEGVTVGPGGGIARLSSTLESYKTNGTDEVPVTFKVQFSNSASGPWSDTPSTWLTAESMYDGSVSGRDFSLNVAPALASLSDAHTLALQAQSAQTNFDLSRRNVATGDVYSGNSLPYSTANCYVVQAPGTYKFPLVYGNGYKKGSMNQSAYQSKDANGNYRTADETEYDNGDNLYLGYYKDHLDADITNPWITARYPKSGLTAQIIWMDSPGLVQNVAISPTENYITFEVPSMYICQGNAMIGVLDASGRIAWSWHIWVTDFFLSGTQNTETISPYQIMNFDLGWCDEKDAQNFSGHDTWVRIVQVDGDNTAVLTSNAAKVVQTSKSVAAMPACAPVYEWGRKDPLQAIIHIGSSEAAISESSLRPYYTVNPDFEPSLSGRDDGGTLGGVIQTPYIYYNGRSSGQRAYNWTSQVDPQLVNLWNANLNSIWDGSNTSGSPYRDDVVKTVYDPCPVGYCVPAAYAFGERSSATTSEATRYGRPGYNVTFTASGNTIFFPFTGLRSPIDGKVLYIGIKVNYWNSIARQLNAALVRNASLGGSIRISTEDSPNYDPRNSSRRTNGYYLRPMVDKLY